MTPYSHVSAITYLMDVSFPMCTGLVTTYTIHNQMCLSLQVYIAMVTDITSNIQTEVCTSPSPHFTIHQAHTQSPCPPLTRLTHNHPVPHSPGSHTITLSPTHQALTRSPCPPLTRLTHNHPVPHSLGSHTITLPPLTRLSHDHPVPHSPGSHTITLSPTHQALTRSPCPPLTRLSHDHPVPHSPGSHTITLSLTGLTHDHPTHQAHTRSP